MNTRTDLARHDYELGHFRPQVPEGHSVSGSPDDSAVDVNQAILGELRDDRRRSTHKTFRIYKRCRQFLLPLEWFIMRPSFRHEIHVQESRHSPRIRTFDPATSEHSGYY